MNRHVKTRHFGLLFVFAGLFLVAACTADEGLPEYVERPVDEIYNDALSVLQEGDYKDAAIMFDEVERQHPYSTWATKAQLMSAYSYYQDDSYDSAVVALDRFIQLHPSSPDVPYAYYLKALCYYEQISDITRDQKMTELAMLTLDELVKRFPSSKYAKDAKLKLDLTRDHLAGKEMEIGRYYLKQGQYLASLNRFKIVIDNYQSTTHVPEALHRLAESYVALGVTLEAQKVAAVLGHNFPGSEWYADAYGLVEGKIVKPKEDDPWYRLW
ncbi:MAG: outer membrane protein assembly factor BamD [Rhodospirillaceae bacterium]|jgi:outer membrane protein assembly factor BamD|nr:outer membrane protein assembly factor BamD [Rhodospirillaceae bacterium]MBT5245086.1 outer membrane protein assembly factor BamD [Rhodospirillaceae bacterium]MBT5562296.1 outer membrane protein assembly factor BamD [Rhodospirillaceae bacterium]MBT6242713.1 outer membrane protein assembly factor BamD [Rhodospirillaceae bacterium]MBT7137569.1 outer membrane protein assembly factor BamD [Rhodospirillaceae bacterium]